MSDKDRKRPLRMFKVWSDDMGYEEPDAIEVEAGGMRHAAILFSKEADGGSGALSAEHDDDIEVFVESGSGTVLRFVVQCRMIPWYKTDGERGELIRKVDYER